MGLIDMYMGGWVGSQEGGARCVCGKWVGGVAARMV